MSNTRDWMWCLEAFYMAFAEALGGRWKEASGTLWGKGQAKKGEGRRHCQSAWSAQLAGGAPFSSATFVEASLCR